MNRWLLFLNLAAVILLSTPGYGAAQENKIYKLQKRNLVGMFVKRMVREKFFNLLQKFEHYPDVMTARVKHLYETVLPNVIDGLSKCSEHLTGIVMKLLPHFKPIGKFFCDGETTNPARLLSRAASAFYPLFREILNEKGHTLQKCFKFLVGSAKTSFEYLNAPVKNRQGKVPEISPPPETGSGVIDMYLNDIFETITDIMNTKGKISKLRIAYLQRLLKVVAKFIRGEPRKWVIDVTKLFDSFIKDL